MTSTSVTYRYAFASDMYSGASRSLDAATFKLGRTVEHPYLFRGKVLHSLGFAKYLSLLSKIVKTHFFLHLDPNYLDPVVTVAGDMIRLECFSGCCGVYARADLPMRAFDGEPVGTGTTNVDFGHKMQLALARITDHEPLEFRVGRDQVELETKTESVIERKVELPVRWVKSFTEVQPLQKQLRDRIQVDRRHATQFFRSLPKGKSPKQKMYATTTGSSMRLTTRKSKGAVPFSGVHRVRVLESLMPTCDFLRVWADEDSGVSGWEIQGAAGRFFALLSPEPYRGFSGEGQNLTQLATEPWEFTQAGFDVVQQSDFERELPLDLSGFVRLQPRLKNANKLLEAGGLSIVKTLAGGEYDVIVPSRQTEHYVRIRKEGDACSCRWFSRYQGKRGPCKHVLAAKMYVESVGERCGSSDQEGVRK